MLIEVYIVNSCFEVWKNVISKNKSYRRFIGYMRPKIQKCSNIQYEWKFSFMENTSFCFLNSTDTTTQPPDSTKSIHVEIVSRNANKTDKNGFAIKGDIAMIPILYGVFISISFFCTMCIIYRKGRKRFLLTCFVYLEKKEKNKIRKCSSKTE